MTRELLGVCTCRATTRDDIDRLTKVLEQERTIRNQKEQYSALARRIHQFPSRDETQAEITRLEAEIAKAEIFFSEGIGESLVDWRYLRKALKYTGVQVNGPEDSYWLETIKGLYSGCT